MAVKVKVEGLRELDDALAELPKVTAKNTLRRTARKVAQPMADDMRSRAPAREGALRNSIGVGTKLTRRQQSQHRKMFKDDRAAVEVFIGAGGLPQAITQEFGTFFHAPQSFARPAWDAGKDTMLASIKTELWTEISKAAQRNARKMARLAAKG